MRFELSQAIAAPVDDVAAAYAGAELYRAMGGTSRIGPPEVLDRVEDGDVVTLRIRYRFVGQLSPAVTAVVDPARLSWVEESVHDLAGRAVAVTLHPDHYADRLRCTATARYQADDDGTRRVVRGDLRVKALLVAGAVERAIVSGLEEHLAAEGPVVEAHLGG
ncbi:MAG TPA: DUF2505 family protein [Acidimicrobiales bacterium]|nr:DUF2505 family protein [Acidimicrobiales bacterium]